jgi:hypothetical protein
MITIQQLIMNRRQLVENKTKPPTFRGCLQSRGVCTRVYVQLIWIRNLKIINRDRYGERTFLLW